MKGTSSLGGALLAPKSIALVGASDNPGKTTGRPLRYLLESCYKGRIYPVNPRRDRVQGQQSWPSLAELPEVPDHAFIMVNATDAVSVVEDCASLGVPVATVLAGGFAEAGPEGRALERRMTAAARSGGVRLLGPNSLGVVNQRNGLVLTANAAFAEGDLLPGHTFVASQSGSIIGALVSRAKARGTGFAGLVSVGGEADLSVGEVCAATLDDDGIQAYALFLESLRCAEALVEFARQAHDRGKAVVAYKLGRSPAGAEMAQSHTGALAGSDDVAAQFLADCGIARLDVFESLIEGIDLVRRIPANTAPAGSRRVGIVTTTGGAAAMVVDQLGVRGITVAAPSPATVDRLRTAGVEPGSSRIVDLTLAGTQYEIARRAVEIMLDSNEYDVVVTVIGSSARSHPELVVRAVADCAVPGRPPIAAFIAPDAPEAVRLLLDHGVPVFRTPETCADAVTAGLTRRAPRPMPLTRRAAHAHGPLRTLDEVSASRLLGERGVPVEQGVVLERTRMAEQLAEATLRYPVAVKLVSDKVLHKSDIGGVVLDVGSEAGILSAAEQIIASVAEHHPELEVGRLLVTPMAEGLGELLVGYRIDGDVGPTVLLAAGGELAELLVDRSVRMAPVDAATAREMVAELRCAALLTGFRNRPTGDLDSVVTTLVAMSRLAEDPRVVEAEINPLLVRAVGQGAVALDAVVQVRDE